MSQILRLLQLLLVMLLVSSCASKFVIKSEPSEAEVYAKTTGREEKISLGKTPLEISQEELQKKAQVTSSSGDFFELIVEKKDFLPERMLVPASRMGAKETIILAKLKPGKEESQIAQKLLQNLFNAQKFANLREFTRAHEEVDKALAIDSEFTRGVSFKASIYFIQKEYTESLKWFEKALALDPNFDDANKMVVYLKKIVGDGVGKTQRLPSKEVSP